EQARSDVARSYAFCVCGVPGGSGFGGREAPVAGGKNSAGGIDVTGMPGVERGWITSMTGKCLSFPWMGSVLGWVGPRILWLHLLLYSNRPRSRALPIRLTARVVGHSFQGRYSNFSSSTSSFAKL